MRVAVEKTQNELEADECPSLAVFECFSTWLSEIGSSTASEKEKIGRSKKLGVPVIGVVRGDKDGEGKKLGRGG